MFKPSRRAAVIAASFALGLSCAGPYAHASLLGGDSESSAVEGLPLPLVGDLLGGGLLGGGLPVVGGLLGGDSSVLAGDGVGGVLAPVAGITSVVPGVGSVFEVLTGLSDGGSLVPGLPVLNELGVLGLLGSL